MDSRKGKKLMNKQSFPKLQIGAIPHPETTLENKIKMLRGHILKTAGNRTDKMYLHYLTGDRYFLFC